MNSGYKNGTSGPEKKAKKKRVKCLGQYGQEKSFKVVLTNLNAYQKTNHRNNNANFKGKTAKNHDFDARGVWRPCTVRKVSVKCSMAHFSC